MSKLAVVRADDERPDVSARPDYRAFLEGKIKVAEASGIEIDRDEINPWLKPHARAIVHWALRGGRRAIFASFGLGKTGMQLEILRLVKKHVGGPVLAVIPLGVRQEFFRDARSLGLTLKFIRRADEIDPAVDVHLTNYETVRDGKLDPSLFVAASLDEAAVLRSFGSKTYQEFLPLFASVKYRFVATATPSPNRTKEIIHYAGFLGILDTGQALTRWFQRNSEKAGDLTLYPHKTDEFWLWVHSWAIFVQKPSDLGFSDHGYELPPLEVRWHEVPSDHGSAGIESDGQGLLFRNAALGVSQAAAEKRDSLGQRIACMLDIIAEDPAAHFLLWHDLEREREAIERAIPDAVSVYGTQELDVRERNIIAFSDGQIKYLATKPELSGQGCNFQRFCHRAIFLGIGFKFHDFIQAIHRIYRFLQTEHCVIDIIHSEAEREIVATLKAKWARHDEMMAVMTDIIRRYGLNHHEATEALRRSIGVGRQEKRGTHYRIVNNDAIEEARVMADQSVDLIVTSIPFSNHYEYVESYNDLGHTDDNDHFWAQMDYLTPELLRVLRPGRLACVHVKDRVLFGNVTGAGLPTISPFHAEAIFHFRRHGFDYVGMITVVTDVVRENNQTYRLGYTEMCKDGSKMGVGSPEYILLFHRPQSDRSRSYADRPVVKSKADYSLARWQIDAHSFWRSSGGRLLTPQEFAAKLLTLGHDQMSRVFREFSLSEVYDHRYHAELGEALGGRLPKTYMALPPRSHHPEVWDDISRMRTLNSEQKRRNIELHVCPLQIEIVERLIERYSNAGETVYDPFMGLGTVPMVAVKLGRYGAGSELSEKSFRDACHYCEAAEAGRDVPTLFDALGVER